MFAFKLPDVGEGMHEGEIVKWLVKEGQEIQVDEPIVEVQTDKVTAELPSPVSGVVQKILFSEGTIAGVGDTLLTIASTMPEERIPVAELAGSVLLKTETAESTKQTNGFKIFTRALATPFVRKTAREMGIDIEQVKGTGRLGQVTEEDLRHFKMGPHSAHVDDDRAMLFEASAQDFLPRDMEERIPLRGVRKKIAERMVKSVSIIPHVTHVDEIEMEALQTLRGKAKSEAEKHKIKLTFLPFFIKAVVVALKEFKMFNASIDDASGEIIIKHYYHIGIAVDTKDGLIVPVIRNADRKTVLQLAGEINRLVNAAQTGKLTLEEITGGTFTITNAGSIGGLYATPIINHPEVAILGLHKMEPRTVVRDWESVIRVMMNVSLSFDHRLIDGAMAIRFTNQVKELIEIPEKLFLAL